MSSFPDYYNLLLSQPEDSAHNARISQHASPQEITRIARNINLRLLHSTRLESDRFIRRVHAKATRCGRKGCGRKAISGSGSCEYH